MLLAVLKYDTHLSLHNRETAMTTLSDPNAQQHTAAAHQTSHAKVSIHQPLQQMLEQLMGDLQLDDAPAGGAVVVYQAGRCIAQASVGMAQADISWQADTLSLNFSTGKGIIAALVHVLVSQKQLDYDTPIAHYWPEFGVNGKAKITLRAVLSHQADLFAITSIDADSEALLDWDQMLKKVAAMPVTKPYPAAAPAQDGSAPNCSAQDYASAYSALIYGWVLGGVIEAATGMPFAHALREYLTEPLGISECCYFGVPDKKVDQVAKLVKDFDTDNHAKAGVRRRQKPTLKADSAETLETYAHLPSYACWQQHAVDHKLAPNAVRLTGAQINRLYFDHSALNLRNYKAALIPTSRQPIDYYDQKTMQATMPAVNGVASAHALATIYAMLANGGVWKDKTLIDSETFGQLSTPQVSGMDAVMPTQMEWRLGYHRLLNLCQDRAGDSYEQGFGHMGYNGSVAWCDPTRQLSFAFVHNFDVTMLADIRQFALSEAVLSMMSAP